MWITAIACLATLALCLSGVAVLVQEVRRRAEGGGSGVPS
jgi:hypothetical protein